MISFQTEYRDKCPQLWRLVSNPIGLVIINSSPQLIYSRGHRKKARDKNVFWETVTLARYLPALTSSGLNPLMKALGTPHSVLIITLCRGWYQKSYPIGADLASQRPLTLNVLPSRRTKPPEA